MRFHWLLLGTFAGLISSASLSAQPSIQGIGGYRAFAISDDGSTVVGVNGDTSGQTSRGWTWNRTTGLTLLPLSTGASGQVVTGTSGDGRFAVGYERIDGIANAVRWDSGTSWFRVGGGRANVISNDGAVIAGDYEGTTPAIWRIGSGGAVDRQLFDSGGVFRAMTPDGATLVGEALFPGNTSLGRQLMRWTQQGGVQQVGVPAGFTSVASTAVSTDGDVIVGVAMAGAAAAPFRWSESGGFQVLPTVPGGVANARATDVTGDGSLTVGWGEVPGGFEALIWDEANAVRPLRDYLASEWGIDTTGWTLYTRTTQDVVALNNRIFISDDGTVLGGTGINPQGRQEAWVVVVPEPGLGLAAMLAAAALVVRPRRPSPSRCSCRSPRSSA